MNINPIGITFYVFYEFVNNSFFIRTKCEAEFFPVLQKTGNFGRDFSIRKLINHLIVIVEWVLIVEGKIKKLIFNNDSPEIVNKVFSLSLTSRRPASFGIINFDWIKFNQTWG